MRQRLRLMRVHGRSMEPALRDGNMVIVSRRHRSRIPHRGDVVVVRPPGVHGRSLVKRVIGVPGDGVELAGRRWTLGSNEFFVLGDQANCSTDSRSFGPVAGEDVLGCVQFRLWPSPQRVKNRNVPNFPLLEQDGATVAQESALARNVLI